MSVFIPYQINIDKLPIRPYARRGAAQWQAWMTSIGVVFCNPDHRPMMVRDDKLVFILDRMIVKEAA